MRYNTDDTYYWYCELCSSRWEHQPDAYWCPECENEEIKAKIIPFTREDWKSKKAELQMESLKEEE